MEPQKLPIEDLCVLEIIYEASEKAQSEGRKDWSFSQAQVLTRIREKKRELKKTGKITTIIPVGTFSTAEVIVDNRELGGFISLSN
jgi:hypothetical protein